MSAIPSSSACSRRGRPARTLALSTTTSAAARARSRRRRRGGSSVTGLATFRGRHHGAVRPALGRPGFAAVVTPQYRHSAPRVRSVIRVDSLEPYAVYRAARTSLLVGPRIAPENALHRFNVIAKVRAGFPRARAEIVGICSRVAPKSAAPSGCYGARIKRSSAKADTRRAVVACIKLARAAA
jgi:hypothetical protein